MDGLVGEAFVTRRRLACGEKGESAMGSRQRNDVGYFQAASAGDTESTVCWARGVLDAVACEMDPVRVLHLGEDFLDCTGG